MPSCRKSAGSPISLARHGDLLERVVVHEGRLAALHVQELHLLLVEPDALDGFLGAEPLGRFVAAAQVAHLDLGEGAALAGLHDLALEDEPELVLVFEDIARLQIDRVDFHSLDLTKK